MKVRKIFFSTHLLFVDDLLLFCDGSWRDANELKYIIYLYSIAYGIMVNLQKSTISFNAIEEGQVTGLRVEG